MALKAVARPLAAPSVTLPVPAVGRVAAVRIRRADIEDADRLLTLLADSGLPERRLRGTAAAVCADHRQPAATLVAQIIATNGLVAEADGVAVGAGWLAPHGDEQADVGLALRESQWLGPAHETLLRMLAKDGEVRGVRHFHVLVTGDNKEIVPMLDRCGLTVVSAFNYSGIASLRLALTREAAGATARTGWMAGTAS